MNNNYARYQVTSTGNKVSTADWFYEQSDVALNRGDLYVGFAQLTINAQSEAVLHMETGANKDVKLVGYMITTDSEEVIEQIIESPTITTGTTELTVYNANRQSTNTPEFTVYTDSTYQSNGTVIYQDQAFEAKKGGTTFGIADEHTHMKFKRSTDYILNIQNVPNSQHEFFVRFYFHESTE